MQKFDVVTPFEKQRRVVVMLEGHFEEQDRAALLEGMNAAALTALTPSYLPWLKSKGGACPKKLPSLLQHDYARGQCLLCGGVEAPAPADPAVHPAKFPEPGVPEEPKPKKSTPRSSATASRHRVFSKAHPKDSLIAALTNERDWLRARVDELEKQLLAVHNANAYRLMHHSVADPTPAEALTPTPYEQRSIEHEPKFSLTKIEQQVLGRIPD